MRKSHDLDPFFDFAATAPCSFTATVEITAKTKRPATMHLARFKPRPKLYPKASLKRQFDPLSVPHKTAHD